MSIAMYNRKYFSEIWNNQQSFLEDWLNSGLSGDTTFSEEYVKKLFILLTARFKNSPIANDDETQFKFKVWAIMFERGATWQRKLEIQKELRMLTTNEMVLGQTDISNHAQNPSSVPSTQTVDELQKIDIQTVSKIKRSKVDALSIAYNALNDNVTDKFLVYFKPLFMSIVAPQRVPLWGDDEEEEE